MNDFYIQYKNNFLPLKSRVNEDKTKPLADNVTACGYVGVSLYQ